MRIIFMGTPEFAVESLRALVEHNFNVVAVVTMPDKPQGRGHHVQYSPVKEYALEHNIPVLQPEKLKDEQFIEELRSYKADLQIVVAFRMLPEVVWAMPPMGTFNLHAALLPQYRGAAPINWAIINGEKETGLTTFFLKQEIDTGDMILQERVPIAPEDDFGSVYERLSHLGADLVLKTVDLIASGNAKRVPQPQLTENQLFPAPKIFKETCEINFNQTAQQVHDFVRGLSPVPTAWCELELGGVKQVVKIFKTRPLPSENSKNSEYSESSPAGRVFIDKKSLKISTLDGYIEILELQLAGKKRMSARDVLNGLRN